MKTSEDKFNEALRDVLKRKFDDYEEQPNPIALERIRARVKPARTGRYWWLTGALVLISVSGILLSRFTGENRLSPGNVEEIQVHASDAAPSVSEAHARGSDEATTAFVEAPARLANPSSLEKARTAAGLKPVRVVKSVFVKDPGSKLAAKADGAHSGNVPGTTVSPYAGLPQADGNLMAGMQAGFRFIPDKMDEALTEEISIDADSAAHVARLEELAAMTLKESLIPLQMRGVVTPAYKPAKVIVTNPARIAWLFNAAVLHSYQILTVPSSAAQDFQNFNFPSLFTARSMGYKFSGGVERNGIQLQLHFSSFKQTYSYEVANDNYLVQPDDKGQYHTVRQGDRMEENRQFSMLGIGVSRQLRWGHSPVSRFFAAFGAEYSHDLNSSQSLGWINLGLGKQFAVSRHTAFSIGPYAEFSPVKVKGTANPFYYQPYRVGISAGLRFVRP